MPYNDPTPSEVYATLLMSELQPLAHQGQEMNAYWQTKPEHRAYAAGYRDAVMAFAEAARRAFARQHFPEEYNRLMNAALEDRLPTIRTRSQQVAESVRVP